MLHYIVAVSIAIYLHIVCDHQKISIISTLSQLSYECMSGM